VNPNGPIFIVGPMGSGSTLLRLVLDSHPHIAVPQETGFMRAYNAHQMIPFKWSGRNWARRLGWSRAELDRELAQFYDMLFMRYVEKHGKKRWGEKCPLHTWHVDGMARLYPDARFVGIVRHPGGCVGSNMSRWGHSVPKGAYHYERYVKEVARQAARLGDRFAVVRYEDLVLQPETLLRELLDFLDEPWADEVLEHHAVQEVRGGKQVVEGRTKVTDPIDISRIDKWTRTLDARTQERLGRRLGRVGEFFGYAMDDPAVLEPLADGSLLARGPDMDARIERFPDLDVRTQMPIPKYERFYHPREFTLADRPERKPATADAPKATLPPSRLRRAGRAVVLRLPRGARRALSAGARALEVERGRGRRGRPVGD